MEKITMLCCFASAFVVSKVWPNTLSSQDYLGGEVDQVSSVSLFSQLITKSPTSVTIVDRNMIKATGAISVVDIFRLVPGFQAYSVGGSRENINYHVLPDELVRRLEVKIDGVSVYDPLHNSVVWGTLGLEIDDIDYIEVVRGPNITSDGSNAFTSSINIVTVKTFSQLPGASIRATTGYANTRELAAIYRGQWSEVGYRIAAVYHSDDGFPDTRTVDVDDDNQVQSLSAVMDWAPSLADTFKCQLRYSDKTAGAAAPGANNPDRITPWRTVARGLSLQWQHNLSDRQHLNLTIYHNYLEQDSYTELGLASEVTGIPAEAIPELFPGVNDFVYAFDINHDISERYEMNLGYYSVFNSSYRSNSGISARLDRATSTTQFDRSSTLKMDTYRVYSNNEITLSRRLTLNLGASVEQSEVYEALPSWRLSFNYGFSDNQSLRLSVNEAKRMPSLFDRNVNFTVRRNGMLIDQVALSDTDLKSERLLSVDLGYFGSFVNNQLRVDSRLFHEKYRNLIGFTSVFDYQGDINQFILLNDNVNEETIVGIEGSINYNNNNRWLINASVTLLDVKGESRVASSPISVEESLNHTSPDKELSLLADFRWNNDWHTSLTYYYQTSVDWIAAAKVDAFDQFDIRLAKDFYFEKGQLSVEFIIKNILNEQHKEFVDYNIMERRGYLKASYHF